jgi:hypothetical protein
MDLGFGMMCDEANDWFPAGASHSDGVQAFKSL